MTGHLNGENLKWLWISRSNLQQSPHRPPAVRCLARLRLMPTTGALTGSNLALVSPDGTDTATFIATFNGVGASGVSAFYYDNNDLPTVNGAIVGSR